MCRFSLKKRVQLDVRQIVGFMLLCVAGAQLRAGEIHVMPGRPGEHALTAAIKAAHDGDVIRVGAGVYHETIRIDKRIEIVGEPGAKLDGAEPLSAAWQEAPAVGPGVYQAQIDRKPFTLMLDGKIVAEISEQRTQEKGPWHWQTLLASGTPLTGYRQIRGAWMYSKADRAIYVHLADNVSPAGKNWSLAPTKDAIVTFKNVAGASIRGLILCNGYYGVRMGACSACTASQCVIGPWDKEGVGLVEGAANCLIERNEIFRGSYEDWTPHNDSKELYEIWQIHKVAGLYDRVGVDLVQAGRDNRVHANHIYETFDGIDLGDSHVESLDIPLSHPDDGRGAEISENLIERTRDSGIELGVGCIDVRVHHNILRQTHGGLRYKLPRIGPVFIYRNLLVGGTPFNIWYSMDDSPAEGYVYHNTIIGGRFALMYASAKPASAPAAANWHYYNNLAITQRGFFDNRNPKVKIGLISDYNLTASPQTQTPLDGQDLHSLYVPRILLSDDYHLLPGCQAIGAGVDLSTAYHGKPLPGCEPGYFHGKAPDIGAFDFASGK